MAPAPEHRHQADAEIIEVEEHEVVVLLPSGSMQMGRLRVEERSDDTLSLSFQYGDRVVTGTGPECWSALCALRRDLEQDGSRLVCYGASRNVYPSGMSRDMGRGDHAYRLEM